MGMDDLTELVKETFNKKETEETDGDKPKKPYSLKALQATEVYTHQ
jgi:hypothetical protein